MKESTSERRLGENEVIFRQANEAVVSTLEKTSQEKGLKEEIRALARQDLSLHFYCECADDKCKERIKVSVSTYAANHRQSNQFIVLPGHEIAKIEKVTKKTPKYFVVQKYMTPPKEATKLHSKKKNL